MDETIEVLKAQRDSLKRKLDAQNRWAIRPAALALFLFGLALVVLWFGFEFTASGYDIATMLVSVSGMSMLLLLAGVAVIALAILLYFLSPARFLRAEVADALTLSGVANIEKLLAALLIEARGIYVPASQAGSTRLFIPVSGEPDLAGLPADGNLFVTPGAGTGGIMLEPPGYRLLAYVRGNRGHLHRRRARERDEGRAGEQPRAGQPGDRPEGGRRRLRHSALQRGHVRGRPEGEPGHLHPDRLSRLQPGGLHDRRRHRLAGAHHARNVKNGTVSAEFRLVREQ